MPVPTDELIPCLQQDEGGAHFCREGYFKIANPRILVDRQMTQKGHQSRVGTYSSLKLAIIDV